MSCLGGAGRPALLACLRCLLTATNLLLGTAALLILAAAVLLLGWMDYYVALSSDVSFTILTFLLSVAGSLFSFSWLACCCIVRPTTHKEANSLWRLILCLYLVVVWIIAVFVNAVSLSLVGRCWPTCTA